MNTAETLAFFGAIVIPIYIFIYNNFRKSARDKRDELDRIKEDIDKLEKQAISIPESFSRVHQRVDNLEQNHNKLESAVEIRLDKFSDKLEKIYDILVEKMSGG